MKKALKIIGIILLLLVIALVAAPFIFRSSIEKAVKRSINENINATVEWEKLDLSLFKSFPDAALTISNFSVINKAPFEGDTLASGKTLKLDMGITQLFKKDNETIKVDALAFDDAFVNIKIDSLGNTNYDIAIKNDAPLTDEDESNNAFTFDLKKYDITNSRINYLDEATKTYLVLTDVNHEGNGDFSLDVSELDTKTTALVSFKIDSTEYLSKNRVALDAKFNIDLPNQKYTFLENEAKINELPLTFDGYVKVNETNNEVDITFKTPSSDFKNFLAIIPKEYAKNLDGVKTTGNFIVDGSIKGIVDETYIPKLDIKIRSDNASFKYPDLPKTVENISINTDIKNDTGIAEDTYVNINNLNFKIDNETFNASGSLKNLTGNMLVDLALRGTLNLANIEKVFPVKLEQQLSGIFKADLTTNFDMASVEKEQYQNIKTNGMASLTIFIYNDVAFKNPIKVSNADIKMANETITLNQLNATSGQTDIAASGNIQNLVPFLMSKQDLKGRFNIKSNTFNINDFMASETEANSVKTSEGNTNETKLTSKKEAIKIPDFLDTTLDFQANKIIYGDIELNNAKGTITIANEKASLKNVTSSVFGGNIALDGNVSTQGNTPTFGMVLDLNKIDIEQSFQKMDLLQFLAPVAKALQGNLNTKIELKGNLTDDLTPVLTSLAGDAFAQLLTVKVDPEKTPLLSQLSQNLSFLNLDKVNLDNLSTKLTFNNGAIQVAPFDFNVKGIKVTASGTHSLDKSINYNVKMDVPAKYMGSSVTNLLAKLDPKDAENMMVALPIGLKGTMTNPKINIDTKSAVTTLTQKLVEKQKQELTNKGTDILKDLIGGNATTKDSTKANTTPTTTQQQTTTAIKNVLGGILGGKKKKQDTTKSGGN